MKTLILAAGRGTRISRYLSGNPKCTVDIGEGKCLIQYTVDLLKSRGIRDIGIVLGYKSQVIRDVLEGREVSFFYNPFYDVTNSIASAWFARDFLEGDDLLIMNGDVYLEDRLLDRILAEKKSPVMFADESRKETADYKFFYEDGILNLRTDKRDAGLCGGRGRTFLGGSRLYRGLRADSGTQRRGKNREIVYRNNSVMMYSARCFPVSVHRLLQFGQRLNCNSLPDK